MKRDVVSYFKWDKDVLANFEAMVTKDSWPTYSPQMMSRRAVSSSPATKSAIPKSPVTSNTRDSESGYSNATSSATTASPQTPIGLNDVAAQMFIQCSRYGHSSSSSCAKASKRLGMYTNAYNWLL